MAQHHPLPHPEEEEEEETPAATLSSHPELSTLTNGDVLCDRHRRDCYVVTTLDETAVGLQHQETEYALPPSLFVSMYGQRLFHIEETATLDTPDWCTNVLVEREGR